MRRPIRRREAGDSNRDGVVNAAEVMAVRNNHRCGLPPLTAPAAAPARPAAAGGGAAPVPPARPLVPPPPRRGVPDAATHNYFTQPA